MKFAQISLVATLAFALLSSCGPGTEDATKAKEIEDSQRNRQAYTQFVGFYKGEVEPINPPEDFFRRNRRRDNPRDKDFISKMVPVEMKIWIEDVPSGVDSNGRSTFRPELKGYYERQDMDKSLFLNVRRPLNIAFQDETGLLVMRNSDTIIGPNPSLWTVSISARFDAGKILGDITYDGRNNGVVRVIRTP